MNGNYTIIREIAAELTMTSGAECDFAITSRIDI